MPRYKTQAALMLEPLPLPAYLWEIDTEKFLASNQAMRDLVGYSEEELQSLDWHDLVHPDEIATAEHAIKVGPTMQAVRWRWRRKDGKVIAVTLSSRKMKFVDDDGRVHDVYIAIVSNVDGDETLPAKDAFPQ